MNTIKTLSLYGLLMAAPLCCNAQTICDNFDKAIYADATVFNGNVTEVVQCLIDTGCSYCQIDSTYAFDVLGITYEQLKPVVVNKNIENMKAKIYMADIDSISFCGKIYKNVKCMISDIRGYMDNGVPDFIVGGDILKREIFMIDTNNLSISRIDDYSRKKYRGTDFRWKGKLKERIGNTIILPAKIGKKNIRFIFDTGSTSCGLHRKYYNGPTEEIERPAANVATKFHITKKSVGRNVETELKNGIYPIDYIILDNDDGIDTLNHMAFKGKRLLLIYKYHKITIID